MKQLGLLYWLYITWHTIVTKLYQLAQLTIGFTIILSDYHAYIARKIKNHFDWLVFLKKKNKNVCLVLMETYLLYSFHYDGPQNATTEVLLTVVQVQIPSVLYHYYYYQ